MVEVLTLGRHEIIEDGISVVFPYRKSKELLFYLAEKKKSSRDEVMGVLWPEEDEESARKNLRNAIYHIRKKLGEESIISTGKTEISLGNFVKWDFDLLIDEKKYSKYRGEFLEGFFSKNSEIMEEWISSTRENIKTILKEALKKEIDKENINEEIFMGLLTLARNEKYDEELFRMLIKVEGIRGNVSRAVDFYNEISENLKKELGVSVDIETKNLLDMIKTKNEKVKKQKHKKVFFHARQEEVELIKARIESYLDKTFKGAIFVKGEAGVGKTRLKDYIAQEVKSEVEILQTISYQAEENYILRPFGRLLENIKLNKDIEIPKAWKENLNLFFPGIFYETTAHKVEKEEISNLQLQIMEDLIVSIFLKMNEKKKYILVFDDIQWMDQWSLEVLKGIILASKKGAPLVIANWTLGYSEKVDMIRGILKKESILEEIQLNRFSKDETYSLIKRMISDRDFSDSDKMRIYSETEGNAFFLIEYLTALRENRDLKQFKSSLGDILKNRLYGISQETLQILDISSMFFDEVTLENLKALTVFDELEILDKMEELQRRFIMKESQTQKDISYRFIHQKLREFIYDKVSEGRKRILHRKIGELLEDKLEKEVRDPSIYTQLIYHYKAAKLNGKALKYSIEHIKNYFDLSHELFPIYSEDGYEGEKIALDRITAKKYIAEIEKIILDMTSKEREHENMHYIMEYYHIKGRFLIREGEYEEGIKNITQLLNYAENFDSEEFLLKGYRQMCFYSIQVGMWDEMRTYLQKIETSIQNRRQYQKVVDLRLWGLLNFKEGKLKLAKKYLNESLDLIEELKLKNEEYPLQRAAVYNYLGDIEKAEKNYEEAITYYSLALKICEEKNIDRGKALFLTNRALALWKQEKYEVAQSDILVALEIYEDTGSLWGKPLALAMKGILELRKNNTEGKKLIKEAILISESLGSRENLEQFLKEQSFDNDF